MIPTISLSKKVLETIHKNTLDLARELKVCGLMNVQYAVKDEEVYVLEVNPRASRTVPFVSKSIGVPLAKIAALVMVGKKLKDIGFTKEIIPEHYSCKEAVFPVCPVPGNRHCAQSGDEIHRRGDGIDMTPGVAYFKTQVAAGNSIPDGGDIFMSIRSLDKHAVVPLGRELHALGFTIHATCGTATALYDAGIPVQPIFKISEGRPNVIRRNQRP